MNGLDLLYIVWLSFISLYLLLLWRKYHKVHKEDV